LCIILIPIILQLFFGFGDTAEEQSTSCLISWVIAMLASYAISAALRERRPSHAAPPPQSQYGAVAPRQDARVYQSGGYQQPPPATYAQPGYDRSRAPARRRSATQSFQGHICRKCGGPVNLDTRKCDYCGFRN
jgi:hypothetical protein